MMDRASRVFITVLVFLLIAIMATSFALGEL